MDGEKAKERQFPHDEAVAALALSADGRLLACAQDEAVRLWDLSGPTPKPQRLSTKVGTVQGLAFSPDSRTLVVGGLNRNLHVWDLSEGKAKEHATIPAAYYWRTLAFSPDGKFLVGCNMQEGVFLWDATSWRMLQKWSLPVVVSHVAFVGDNRHLALGNLNGTIYILRLAPPPQTVAR
jgi:WD40 repeat protein